MTFKHTPFIAFIVTGVLIWSAVFVGRDANIHVIACDVGQGDALLIQHKSSQILIDGGPDDSVLSCLSRHMPYWDRTLELAIATHGDADHITGLIDVAENYTVDTFLTNEVRNGSQTYRVLEETLGGQGAQVIFAEDTKTTRLGVMQLDILHPSRAYTASQQLTAYDPDSAHSQILGAFTSSKSTNTFSVVTRLTYGDFDAVFTGDIDPVISDYLAENNRFEGIEYLKIPHHGSKNGLTQALRDAVNPKVAVISVGKNQWGHPHQEILDMLKNVQILRTDQRGDIEVVSDGSRYWVLQ